MGLRQGGLSRPRRASNVLTNAYHWAHPAIDQMMRHHPAAAIDFLRADAASKHFVALAIRGWETRHGRSEPVLQQLAGEIFSRPRPVVLAELWRMGFGKLNFLKRLPGRVLLRRQYDQLVAIVGDPQRRHLLHQCPTISPVELDIIAHFDQPTLSSASVRKIAKIGVELFDYMIAVVRQHRPDLDDTGLLTALRELSRGEDISIWLRRVLRHADLPLPPWNGMETITPLRTVAEIQLTGVEMRNCLFDDDRSLAAILGECCYYTVSGRYGPAVVAVVFDALLGAWRIESYRGPANAKVTPAAAKYIVAAFAEAGIRFFGECPRERALDGLDAFHPP
jgi:hypothetical protein